jgi:hypothetical protein
MSYTRNITWATLLVALLAVPFSRPAGAGAAASITCAGGWTIVPSPSSGYSSFGNDLLFTSVTSADATHVWAVGNSTNLGGNLIEHWNGTRWTNVGPAAPHVFLYGVAAYAATSAWAVGGGATTVTEQWDGTQWTIVPSPNGQDDDSQLNAVAMDSAQSAWAVGDTYGTAPQQSVNLIERFC